MGNYDLLTNKKNKKLYKKYYGLIFSELAESQQGELLNNGFDVWTEGNKDNIGCIIDFNCGLSISGQVFINDCECVYLIDDNKKLYDSQIGIIE